MFSTNFVAASTEYCDYLHHIPAPYMRRNFTLETLPQKAEITICGLGFYELYINGRHITKGYLAPYISNPDNILYYDRYNLTPYLRQGNNTVGILLGNGMLNSFGGTVWEFDKATFRAAPKVAFTIEITDGTKIRHITADTKVKVHPSPILMDDLRCGEYYDAREEIRDWNLPDFDDSDWNNAIPAATPKGVATLCTAEPIVVLEERAPLSVTADKRVIFYNQQQKLLQEKLGRELELPEKYSTGYLYDFGVNLAGNTTLRIKGKRGQEISIIYGELLTDTGDLDKTDAKFLPHFYDHRVTYTLKGEGVEEYTPTFSYQGFRYCLVAGLTPEQATPELLTYKVMSSDLQKNGDFSCSDEVANRLYQAAYHANISNFYYFPTDCPHREKNGWTGDAALSAAQLLFHLTPENSFKVWLDNIRAAQRDSGELPGIIPTAGWGFDWGNGPAWDAVLFQLPYQTWLHRGDTAIIRENAAAMYRYLQYVASKRDENGLLHIGLGDWLPPMGKAAMCPLEVTDTLVTMNNCRLAVQMFDVVALAEEKAFAENLWAELRAAAREHLLSEGGEIRGCNQTTQAMAIAYGLLEPEEISAAFALLLKAIHDADGHLETGCLGARVIFHCLEEYGEEELAYQMITRTDFPSFGYWVTEQNATTLFERFDRKPGWPGSLNHHFWGDFSYWFFRCITGVKINPHATDHTEIEISPHFISTLTHAEGYIGHPLGKISAAWKREGNEILFTLTLPQGLHGVLLPPRGYICDTPLQTGTHVYTFKAK